MEFLRLDCERAARTPLEICTSFKAKSLSKSFKHELNLIKTLLSDLICSSNVDLDNLSEELPLITHELKRVDGQTLSVGVLAIRTDKMSLSDFLLDLFRLNLVEGRTVCPLNFHHLEFHFSHLEDLPSA